MYSVWQNPYTLRFWVVDEKGKGFPGPIGGPYLTHGEAASHLDHVNKVNHGKSEKEIAVGTTERNTGDGQYLRN